MLISDASGATLCSAPVAAAPVKFSEYEWFNTAVATDGLLVGDVIVGPISGLRALTISYGFQVPGRSERLAAFAGVDLRWLAKYLASLPLPAGGRLIAFDHHGALIAAEPGGPAANGEFAQWLRPVAREATGASRVMQAPDGRRWAVSASSVGDRDHGGMHLVVALDLAEASVPHGLKRWPLILALAGVMAVTGLAVMFAARMLVVLPLRRVTNTAGAVAQGDLSARVGEPYPGGELGNFMRAFDNMADKLRQHVNQSTEDQREKVGLYRRLNDVVYRMAPDSTLSVSFISDRARDLFDAAPETLLGPRDNWKSIEFVTPELELVNAMLRHAIERRQPIDVIYRIRTAFGGKRWIWERAEPITDTNGTYQGYEGVLTDITDKKRVEQDMIDKHRDLSLHYGQLLDAIAALAEARDPYTAGHQRRVASLAVAIAREMGLPNHRIDGLALAARIHDVGKMGVPGDILTKPTRLSEAEYAMVKEHVKVGYDVLKSIEFPWPIAQIVLQHHERLDGSGYPNGIKGEQMLPEARILAVADVVESMASHRPYRPQRSNAEVKAELRDGRGSLYDAEAVDVALRFLGHDDLHLDDDAESLMPAAPPLDFSEVQSLRNRDAALLKPEM